MIRVKLPHFDKSSKSGASQKFLLLFLTVLQIIGIVTIPVGIWVWTRFTITGCSIFSRYKTAGYLLMTGGILSVLLCWIGLVLVSKAKLPKQNEFRPFIFMLSVIIFLYISASISATVNNSDLNNKIFSDELYKVFHSNNSQECAINIQTEFLCCGYENYTDLFNSTDSVTLLKSCGCTTSTCLNIYFNSTSFHIFSVPCLLTLQERVGSHNLFVRVYGAVISIFVAILFTVISAMLHRISGLAVVETKTTGSRMDQYRVSMEMFQVNNMVKTYI